MSVHAVYLEWRREYPRDLARDIAAAVQAFQARAGLPATHLIAPPGTGYPPASCPLIYQESSLVHPGILRVGVLTEVPRG